MSCFLPLIVSYAIVSDALGRIKGINSNGNQLSMVEQTLGKSEQTAMDIDNSEWGTYGFYNLISNPTQPIVDIGITILTCWDYARQMKTIDTIGGPISSIKIESEKIMPRCKGSN
jgi:hypothetical protein